jgi:AcrR family transcriptional regulator
MSRPSLKSLRTDELLDAFQTCIARHGLDGSTLERISEQANVSRPLLRHYLGNREQMVESLLQNVLRKFDEMNQSLVASLPETGRLEALLDTLFNDPSHNSENAAVFQALVAASTKYDKMAPRLMAFVTSFEAIVSSELKSSKPESDPKHCDIAAAGITAIYFNYDAVTPLNPGQDWREKQQQAIRWLLDAI